MPTLTPQGMHMNFELDCDRHPAFPPSLRPAGSKDDFVDIFSELDQAVQEYNSSSYKTLHYIERIERKFEESVNSDGFVLQDVKPYLIKAMKSAVKRLVSELEDRSQLLAKRDSSSKNP